MNPKTVVLAIPAPFKIDRISQLAATQWKDSTIAMANPYLVREACLELGLDSEGWKHPMPTVGFSLLFHLLRFPQIEKQTFYLTGFDWHIAPHSNEVDRVAVHTNHLPSHYNHSYLREGKWVARNLMRRRNWAFSESTWEALKFIEPFARES